MQAAVEHRRGLAAQVRQQFGDQSSVGAQGIEFARQQIRAARAAGWSRAGSSGPAGRSRAWNSPARYRRGLCSEMLSVSAAKCCTPRGAWPAAQEQREFADVLRQLPGSDDAGVAARADLVDFQKPLRSLLHDVHGLLAEFGDDDVGELGTERTPYRTGHRRTLAQLPGRLYNDEPPPDAVATPSPRQRHLLYFLYSRHHDGIVRRRHLEQVVGCAGWVVPFVVQVPRRPGPGSPRAASRPATAAAVGPGAGRTPATACPPPPHALQPLPLDRLDLEQPVPTTHTDIPYEWSRTESGLPATDPRS